MALKLHEVAKKYVGKTFNTKSRLGPYCAWFVRDCLAESDLHAFTNRQSARPVDYFDGMPLGIGYANSLCGEDLGDVGSDRSQLQPGDLVFFKDTYDGPWPKGTITHIGIYVGNGEFVHKPSSTTIAQDSLMSGYWADKYRCWCRVGSHAKHTVKLFYNEDKGKFVLISNQLIRAGQEVEVEHLTCLLSMG